MTTLTIEAVNTAPDSPNRIHTEEARRYGFQGGIVPGLTMYGYLVQPLIERYGDDWLASGQMEARFRRPVYDGEQLTLSVEPNGGDDDGVDLLITKGDDEVCVRGSARRHRDDKEIDVERYPRIPYDGSEPPAGTPERMAELPGLAEWQLDTSREYVTEYLGQLGVDRDVFDRYLHPAVIARVSAYIVGRRFRFGPRIHFGVRSRFLAAAPVDAKLTGRGRIKRVWENKGNHYFESDLLVVDADDRPIMQIDSESLFQLGSGANA